MASYNFTLGNAINLYTRMFTNFTAFPILAIVALVFILIIAFNLENKNSHFLFCSLNIILIFIICWTHGINILNNVDSFWKTNILKNIYFYLTNMLMALIVISTILRSRRVDNRAKCITMVFYYFILLNLLQMLYMSNYLQNIMLLVIGNTYPMIYFGNIVAFLMYISLIIYWLFFMKKRKKHRLGNHL